MAVECGWPNCGRRFIVCLKHFHARRYCSDECRDAARRASCRAARLKYRESIKRVPELLAADQKKRAARAKTRRAEMKNAKADGARCVPEQSSGLDASCRRLEDGQIVESAAPTSVPARSEGPAAQPGVTGSTSREEAIGACGQFFGTCCVCGVFGRVRGSVSRDASDGRRGRWSAPWDP